MGKGRLEWIFVFFVCLCKVTDSLTPELHTILSKSELIRYLDTDSQDTVPDYDVIQVVHHKSKRHSHSSQRRISLRAFGKDIELLLEPNDDVIGGKGLSVERRTAGGLLNKETYFPRGQFFVGHVVSEPESHVAVREEKKKEKGQLSGAIMSDGHLYQIEPLPGHLHRRAALEGTGYHVISRRSMKIFSKTKKTIPIAGIKHIYRKAKYQRKQDDSVINHDSVYTGPVFIEAMLTADKTTCDYYGNGTLDYLLNAANLISRLYKDSSIGMNVNWVLVKVFLLEGFDPNMDITTNNIRSAKEYLGKYRKWSAARNTPDGTEGHYDQAALLTRRICGLTSCYIDGLAYFNTPCNKNWGVSIDEARGLTVAYTVAHEMGHNIGLKHDTGDCAGGYIMNSVQPSGSNAFHWSRCSRERLQKIFTKNTCFHNKPPKQLPSPTLPPGYTIDRDKQCKLAYGAEFRACSALRESCGALYCTKDGSCYSRGAPVAEGTICGYRKWCRAGKCSNVGSSLPPPVDGGWGSWGAYGACTRTCGGGVKYRSRQCNNPTPQYFGKDCKGSNKGHFTICNNQECAEDLFRQQQCEEHNSGTKKYSAYYLGGAQKCTLACVHGRRGSYFGHVKDGTRCERNPYVYDVCIEGKCNKVGCDKKLRSEKVYDRCLNCGGDGGSCVLTKRTYTKNYRVWGPRKGDTMVIIPKGATRVLIREMSKSKNFLSVVSIKTGKYYVPVPSWTATYKAAGTSIYHYMSKLNDAEIIYIRGPTNEALQAKFVYSGHHVNPGILYTFYTPGNAASAKFIWKQKNEGSCSASCAGGIQLIRVTCHRDDDDTEVTPVYCDVSSKPAESIPCNQAPCPKRFQRGVWSPCSEKCGGGQQYRNLTCAQVVSKDVTNILPNSECAHLPKPITAQECNKIDCFPEWIAENWTQCSVPCGGGNKTRQVECKKKLGNGKWTVLTAGQCSDVIGEKPPNSTRCHAMPCRKWRVLYPCVSCGGSSSSYVPIGCFQDKNIGGRPLPGMVGNHRNNINWHRMSLTVKKCALDAWRKQFAVFGVQFYGECWSGILGYETYDKDGFNLQGCWEGVGKSHNNYVYAFTSLIVEPLVDCIYTVTNQTVSEDKCSSPKPHAKMKLCSHVCSNATNTG